MLPILERCPEVLRGLRWVWDAYWEIDRDGMSGALTMTGMRAVLDEWGVTDRERRYEIRQLWRAMHAEEANIREKNRKESHGSPGS